ncbi:GerMN domain-containing protein [Geomonas subterranea]|uniref:GerMN domain-containing protein n=1 Tax=Geomonas subterranea TaxID=2847989 RepID=A0ABX8LDK8_9BACT|nr:MULTISPECIES: GerMN domain-containing protein [Geomonas]QXE89747.1 GerMN domain-containing protein [Geomonas subterranea]QXM08137.1 GerMN domain-containing protein [Geomonas subterranea]
MKRRANRAKGVLLIAFLVFAVVVGLLVFRKYETATKVTPPAAPAEQVDTRVVTLFFSNQDGSSLAREGREIAVEDTTDDMIASVVDELVVGPLGDLAPTLPHNARVIGAQLKGDVVQVDFSKELVESLPEGSSAEMSAVYSVVDTVVANFPQVKAVQFLVDGVPVKELKGHLDLSAPIAADFTLEKKEAPAAPEKQ